MNKLVDEKQSEEYQENLATEWRLIDHDINSLGLNVGYAYEFFMQRSDQGQEKLIPLLLEHAEKQYSEAAKDRIYRIISCAKWLKGELLTSTIETLFRHFENDEMTFNHFETDKMMFYRRKDKDNLGVNTRDEISTGDIRWVIGLALNALIRPKLVGHKKYQYKLRTLLKEKKYRKGRSELVTVYARLGKQEVIPDLINLLDGWDLDVLGRTIEALGKLKAKEAKPYLEKLLRHEDPYFRTLARKALKKIG